MSTVKQWVKPQVYSQKAYTINLPKVNIKLNQNESAWDWPDAIKQSICDKIKSAAWNRYPELQPQNIKEKLAQKYDLCNEQLLIGNGSNEILQAIITAVIKPGDKVLTLSPTFAMYKILAEQRGCKLIECPLDNDFNLNPSKFLGLAKDAKLVILCNPNSPTGKIVDNAFIESLLDTANCPVIIDEAYADYSSETALPLVNLYNNLIITRTFSKAFALAGFRAGFAIMQASLAENIQKCLLPFNVDTSTVIVLECLLEYEALVKEQVHLVVIERDALIAKLNTISGVRAITSHANFFMVQASIGADLTFNHLLGKGILARDISSYAGCADMLRITVGSIYENQQLLQAFRSLQ